MSQLPLQLTGDVYQGRVPIVRSMIPTTGRRDRFAETFGTVEVNGFTVEPATRLRRRARSASRTRAEVFSRLPELAVEAPGATIRTSRYFNGTTYTYGAQLRDPNLTEGQRSAVLTTAGRIGVAVSINTVAAETISPNSPTPITTGDQLVGDGVSARTTPEWTTQISRWSTPPELTDEPTQVTVRQAPIVAILAPLPLDADTVIDATIRIVPRKVSSI